MTQKNKKTIAKHYEQVMELLNILAEMTEDETIKAQCEESHTFSADRLEKTLKKNASRGSGTSKVAEANKALAEVLYERMVEGTSYTATQLYGLGVEGITSPSKVTAVVKHLTADGRVTVSKGKTGNLYTA